MKGNSSGFISTFGSIKHKLAEQVIRTFASESAVYRVSKDIDTLMLKNKQKVATRTATIEAISHYAWKLQSLRFMVLKP